MTTTDDTPTEAMILNPANTGLVRGLSTHAVVLWEVRRALRARRDEIALRTDMVPSDELFDLAKQFRSEGDSAHALARLLEDLHRKRGGL